MLVQWSKDDLFLVNRTAWWGCGLWAVVVVLRKPNTDPYWISSGGPIKENIGPPEEAQYGSVLCELTNFTRKYIAIAVHRKGQPLGPSCRNPVPKRILAMFPGT